MTPNFPITPFLTEICDKLKASASHALVLTAETGAGKSTVLPLGLLENFGGKILMTEPRRLAVLGVASRVSDLLGEKCGQTVGYKIHLESKIGPNTRLEVMTEAVLVRMLQEDPALEDYNLVVLDEAHERSVNFDLALAFLREAMELRDDLYVIIMSATIDGRKFAAFLDTKGTDPLIFNSNTEGSVPLVSIPGRTFPVEVIYDTKSTIEQVILKELESTSKGNILVFLPGISDIRRCEENLRAAGVGGATGGGVGITNSELFILHSSISLDEQRKVLTEGTDPSPRRVILSSAIAETSLTVPGITTVIDSGLSRVSRMDIATGMQKLVTERESEFSADQRKGRAGRLQEGRCIRLWSQHDVRIQELEPEILRCDLTELVLECADRGITDFSKIRWLDSPNAAEWSQCVNLLQQFDFLTAEKRITPKGRAALTLGLHPRLANVVLESGCEKNLSPTATKLLIKYGGYDKSAVSLQNQFLSDVERRLSKLQGTAGTDPLENSALILAGFPDRLAHRISKIGDTKTEYQFPSGRKAILAPEIKITPEWIVAPEVLTGTSEAKIFEFEEIPESVIQKWLSSRTKIVNNCEFSNGKVKKSENLCYGKIILSSKNLPAEASDYAAAWVNEVRNRGLSPLPTDKQLELFLNRAAFYFQQNNKGDVNQYLVEKVEEWLPGFITTNSLSGKNVYDAVYWFLEGSKIDSEVPEILILPNGKKAKVKYELLASPENKNQLVIRPVIEIIIQRMFGCFTTPKICGMKVLLRLLSPASRPLQITDDLENFWTSTWTEICKEMKGRYPKHNWDYKIVEKGD